MAERANPISFKIDERNKWRRVASRNKNPDCEEPQVKTKLEKDQTVKEKL
jgi:hypothetical protein